MSPRNPVEKERAAAGIWSTADPSVLASTLRDPVLVLDAAVAHALRDRCASFLMSDPSLSLRLSGELQRAARRQGSSLPAEVAAVAWRCRAEALLFTGRLKAAGQAYARATEDAERARTRDLLGQILVGRVHVLSLLGDGASADRLARKAERLLRAEGDLVYLGKLYMNRGNADYQRERHLEAYRNYRAAAQMFERAGMRDATLVGLLVNQGIACTNLARLADARALFLEAERRSEQLALASLAAHARFNRAFLEKHAGDLRAALALLERAGETFAQQSQRDMLAAAQRSRAEIYLDLGMPSEACELAQAAAETFAGERMALDAVLARVDLARGQLETGRAADAVAILDEAAAFFARRRLWPRRAAALLDRARAERALGDAAAAHALARRARSAFEALRLARGACEARRLLADLCLAGGQTGRAERILRPPGRAARALPLAERIEYWSLAGRISLARGRPAQAAVRLRRAARLVEIQRRLIPGAEFRARAFARQVRVYQELMGIALMGTAPRFAPLFALVETARARGFRDRLLGAPSPAWQRISEKRALLGSLTGRLEQAELSGAGLSDRRRIAELLRSTQALEKELVERLRRAEAALEKDVPWGGAVDPDRIAALLAPGETLLEYYVVGDRVIALLLRAGARAARVLPETAAAIARMIRRVRFQLDATALVAGRGGDGLAFRRGAAEAALGDLHRALLEPLAGGLPASGSLLVVPHAALHQVPFECLHDGTCYLDDRFQVTRVPAADFLLRREARAGGGSRRTLVCGTIRRGPAFAASEIESVAGCFPARTTDVLRDAGSEAVLAALPAHRVIHWSTHGLFRRDNPLFSRLTTDDGAVFLADILGIRLDAELVVLSACESGEAGTGSSDELAGVAHGFLSAGAHRLLASRWRVHDAATRALMLAFYGEYRGRAAGNPARALRDAQRLIRCEWDHPFFWGGFSVYGE